MAAQHFFTTSDIRAAYAGKRHKLHGLYLAFSISLVVGTLAHAQHAPFQLTTPNTPETIRINTQPSDSTREWIVVFDDRLPEKTALANRFESDLQRALNRHSGSLKASEAHVKALPLINGAVFSAPTRVLPELLDHSYIAYIDINHEVTLHPVSDAGTISTGYFGRNLTRVADGGIGVNIAIIDTGVDYTHPDLGGCLGATCKVIGGYDTVDDDPDPFDENGHGTHVAGIAAGTGLSNGVAQGAKILAYRALNAAGSGTFATTIEAIERAIADGAHIINMSLGSSSAPPGNPLNLAVREAVKQGVLVVASAGNNGPQWGTISSPGNEELALTVGAIRSDDMVAAFSSRGPSRINFALKPDVSAPGVDILSAVPGGGHLRLSGTSMAAPHVAGIAALYRERMPQSDVLAIKARIIQSARPLNQPLWHTGLGKASSDIAHSRQVAIHPASISVRVSKPETIDGTQIVEGSLRAWNFGDFATNARITWDVPAGVDLQMPQTVNLPSLGEIEIPYRILIDPNVVTYPTDSPPIFMGSIRIVAHADTVVIPILVARPSEIVFEFQSPPSIVVVHDRKGGFEFRGNPGRVFSMLTGAGSYDVWAIRDEDATKWVFEGVEVLGSTTLTVNETDAKNTLRYDLSDPNGVNVGACGYSREFLRHKPSKLALSYQYERSCAEVSELVIQNQISDISSHYLYEVSHVAYGAATAYEYLRYPFRFDGGITGNRLLRSGGTDFKPVRWHYVMPSGIESASFIRIYETIGGNIYTPPSWLKYAIVDPWYRTEYLTANPDRTFAPFHRQYDKIYAMEANQFDPDQDAVLLTTPSAALIQNDSLILGVAELPSARDVTVPYDGEPIVIGAGPDSWSPGSMTLTDQVLQIPTTNSWFLGWNREMRTGIVELEVLDERGQPVLGKSVKNGIPNLGSIKTEDWITIPVSNDYHSLHLTRSDTWLETRNQVTSVSVALNEISIQTAQNCIHRVAMIDPDGFVVQRTATSSGVHLVIESRNCDIVPDVTISDWKNQGSTRLSGSITYLDDRRITRFALPEGLPTGYVDVDVRLQFQGENLFRQTVSPALLLTNNQPVEVPPKAPSLTSPASRQFVFDNQVELKWNEVDGAYQYRVQLAMDADFAMVVEDSTVNVANTRFSVYGYGIQWYWRVSAKNDQGWGPWSLRRSFTTVIESTTMHETDVPHEWYLGQNFPNPFNPSTQIQFGIGAVEPVRLEIYSLTGQLVKSVDFGTLNAGSHSISVDLGRLASGLYLYQISTPSFRQSKKMTLIK